MSLTWYAAKTNPRCETRAERSLTEAGFAAYCPRDHVVRKNRNKAEVHFRNPLLTGYVFVGFRKGREDFYSAGKCDGVKRMLGGGYSSLTEAYEAIPSRYIEDLCAAEFRGEFSTMMQTRKAAKPAFRPRDLVEVTAGVFATKNGVIAKMMGKNKAVVQIEDLLGTLAEITIPVERLRAA